MRYVRSFLTVLIFLSAPSIVAPLPQSGDSGLVQYAEGLDALSQGRWTDAASAFSQALESSGDDPTIVLARGVANTLAEDFPRALKDLERARRLGLKSREADLWTYVAEAMSGIVGKEHALGGFRGAKERPAVVSIPGHMVQGSDDYPTDYASFIVYQLGMEYQKHRIPADYGGSGNPNGTKSPQMRQAMLNSGRLFAEKWLKRPELASINLARAKESIKGKGQGSPFVQAQRVLAAQPSDPEARYLVAQSWLDLGRPAIARREFTIALTNRTDFTAAYLGRAMAAARLGNAKRVRADLDSASRLDGAITSKARGAIEAELAKQKVEGSADRLLGDLEQAAKSDTPLGQLIEVALKVHKITGEQRLRYDEIYQDRLQVLEDAVRANPKNPDKFADLAQYLVEEADNRGEKVEPRRALVPYRWQESREKELGRAIQIADRALALNGKHVGGMMQKALALTSLKQYDQAEALADQILRIAGNNPDALRLYAKFRSMRANQMSSEAWSLRQERCSSSTTKEDLGDRIRETTTTTCIPPSQADLNRAAQLEAQASELRRKARAAMEAAVKASKGTVEGYLIQADLHLWDGKLDAAQAALQQAIKLDPKSLEAQDQLVQFYARTGQQDKADEQQAIARQLIHTTAGPMLRMAWRRIDKTAWQGAKAALSSAKQLDPADARTPAYLGVVFEGDDKPAEAVAAFRRALALEEARLRLDEPVVRTDKPVVRDALDFGLAMQARFRLAAPMEQDGKLSDALALYQGAVYYEPRMAPDWESRQMFSAMLPDQKPVGGAVVAAPVNAATLMADAHLRLGKLLAKTGKRDEAIEHFTSAAILGPLRMAGIPQVGNARGDTNFSGIAGAPAAEAQLYLAQALVAKGDVQGASKVLYEAGRNLPAHLRSDLNELNMAMARMHSNRPRDPYEGRSPEERQYADLQNQQDQERMRMAMRHMAPRAKVVPELLGIWELTPDNKFLPWKKTLTVQANADFTLMSQNDGATSRGKIDVLVGRDVVRGRSEPSRGQMMLYDETSGQIGTMYYEFVDRHVMQITDLDGTKYEARRKQ
ncbi:MAG: tetratricopeptide repeat protein [Nitrospiraceae bacterium]